MQDTCADVMGSANIHSLSQAASDQDTCTCPCRGLRTSYPYARTKSRKQDLARCCVGVSQMSRVISCCGEDMVRVRVRIGTGERKKEEEGDKRGEGKRLTPKAP